MKTDFNEVKEKASWGVRKQVDKQTSLRVRWHIYNQLRKQVGWQIHEQTLWYVRRSVLQQINEQLREQPSEN